MRGVDRFFAHKTTFSKNASPVLKVLPPPNPPPFLLLLCNIKWKNEPSLDKKNAYFFFFDRKDSDLFKKVLQNLLERNGFI